MTVEAIGNVDMGQLNKLAHPFGFRVYQEEMTNRVLHPAIGPNSILARIAHAVIPIRQDIAVISKCAPEADEIPAPELNFYVHNKKNLPRIKKFAEATETACGVRVAVTSPPKDSTLFWYSSWRR